MPPEDSPPGACPYVCNTCMLICMYTCMSMVWLKFLVKVFLLIEEIPDAAKTLQMDSVDVEFLYLPELGSWFLFGMYVKIHCSS